MSEQSEKRKIAFFLTGLRGSGGERVVLIVANQLAQEGYMVELLLLEKVGVFLENIDSRITVTVLPSPRLFKALFYIRRYIHKERPFVMVATSIHTQVILLSARIFSQVRPRMVMRIGIPLSIRLSSFSSIKDRVIGVLAPRLFRGADCIVANSQGVASDSARTLKLPIEKFSVIYNPINGDDIAVKVAKDPTHPWFQKKEIPVIIAAGRLRKQKGFDILISAFAKMDTPARLVILGKGEEENALRKQAQKEGVADRVDFPGFAENPYAFFARSYIFVLSSRWEGFPNVLVEAMASGAPVVATDCPYGSREILAPHFKSSSLSGTLYRRYGDLVPVDDPTALAQALDSLLSDTTRRAEYIKKGKERVKAFSLERIIPQYKKALGLTL